MGETTVPKSDIVEVCILSGPRKGEITRVDLARRAALSDEEITEEEWTFLRGVIRGQDLEMLRALDDAPCFKDAVRAAVRERRRDQAAVMEPGEGEGER